MACARKGQQVRTRMNRKVESSMEESPAGSRLLRSLGIGITSIALALCLGDTRTGVPKPFGSSSQSPGLQQPASRGAWQEQQVPPAAPAVPELTPVPAVPGANVELNFGNNEPNI